MFRRGSLVGWKDVLLQSTSTELLNGLRDPRNHAAWFEFCARYEHVLLAFALKLGLSDADAQDATQETFLSFARAFQEGRYERQRGRLRSWLFRIMQNKVYDIYRRQARSPVVAETGDQAALLAQVVDEDRQVAIWEEEWRQAVVRTCLKLVRRDVAERTFAAFEGITLRGVPPDEVASQLGMTRAAVDRANQRVLSRMKELHRVVEVEW